jgi:hypothetical protein
MRIVFSPCMCTWACRCSTWSDRSTSSKCGHVPQSTFFWLPLKHLVLASRQTLHNITFSRQPSYEKPLFPNPFLAPKRYKKNTLSRKPVCRKHLFPKDILKLFLGVYAWNAYMPRPQGPWDQGTCRAALVCPTNGWRGSCGMAPWACMYVHICWC